MKDIYRGKFVSVIVQPRIDPQFWGVGHNSKQINDELLNSGFPVHTEIHYALSTFSVETANRTKQVQAVSFAFGTETSRETKIPHYQIYIEFPQLVRLSSVYENLDKLLQSRVHIVTQKVYNESYKDYCLKESSNFEFDSNHYWNVKIDSTLVGKLVNKQTLIKLRPKLKMIKNNYFTGQKLIEHMAFSEPDDRTGIWLADVIGGTGKTAFFQTIVNHDEGLYLRVSEGVERLSAKLRKKITTRLEEGSGYPKFIWINFGRTVEEGSLKAFADFGEQILDGMLDDNFGNTAGADFMPLPYVNLFVTANTPPNLNQLTGDRIKLLTLFPIFDIDDDGNQTLIDSILIPIYVEIKVRIMKRFPNMLQYRFKVKLQDDQYIRSNFSQFPYYEELLENVRIYKEFKDSPAFKDQLYQSKMISEWVTGNPNNIQQDIKDVYAKALFHSALVAGSGTGHLMIEASSFKNSEPKVYSEPVHTGTDLHSKFEASS